MTPTFVLVAFGLLGAMISAIGIKAFQTLAWHELQKYCRKRNVESLFDEIHAKEDQALIAIETTQIICTFVVISSVCSWYVLQKGNAHFQPLRIGYSLTLGGVVLMAALLWVPREVAAWFGVPFLVTTWPIWRIIIFLFKPILVVAQFVETLSLRAAGNNSSDRAKEKEKELEDEIRSLVVDGQHEKSLDPKLREMIEGVINLDDNCARDIMRHKSEIDAISVDDTWENILQIVVECGRTRVPVYEKNLDNIIGTLFVKDLFKVLSDHREMLDVRSILREPCEIPETMSLHELLKMFLATKMHQAIVIDEFHATLGLVTIEDIVEEIVGEIVDEGETDDEDEVILQVSDHSVVIAGDAHLDEINELVETEIPSGHDFNTLGGFLITNLKEIPKPGVEFAWNELSFRVEEATKRQILSVRLTVPQSYNLAERIHAK